MFQFGFKFETQSFSNLKLALASGRRRENSLPLWKLSNVSRFIEIQWICNFHIKKKKEEEEKYDEPVCVIFIEVYSEIFIKISMNTHEFD